jgi:hypothetical protein
MNYKQKINLDYAGVSFTDELHADVGAAAFGLDHDCYFNNAASGEILIIRTAAGGGGSLLVEGIDYLVGGLDDWLTAPEQTDKYVYSTVQITNVTYQSGSLYFSGKYVGDYNDSSDINLVTPVIQPLSDTGTVVLHGYDILLLTTGSGGIRESLPSAIIYANCRIDIIKVDSGLGCGTILNAYSQTFNGLSYLFLTEQWQKVSLVSNGANWIITSGVLYFNSGGRNTADWTNRELGFWQLTYDTKVGTILIGDLVTETETGYTGIVIADSGTVLILIKATGKGYATNNNHLTFSISGATALVNNGTTDKNQDTSCVHGTGLDAKRFEVEVWAFEGTTFSWTNARILGFHVCVDGANVGALSKFGIDTNTIKIQTGGNGVYMTIEDSSRLLLAAQDYSYNVVLKLMF